METEHESRVEWSGGRERAHVERFCPVLYLVVAPAIAHIRTHQLSGSWVEGGVESGGASFAQHSTDPPAVIITGLGAPAEVNGLPKVCEAQSLRPAGVVHDRLAAIRYPNDYGSYDRADWDRWVLEIRVEADSWVLDDAQWTSIRVTVDDGVYDGVQTTIDRRCVAAAFYLPEGRLDVAIQCLGSPEQSLSFDEIRIVRSTDLDRVDWHYQPDDGDSED